MKTTIKAHTAEVIVERNPAGGINLTMQTSSNLGGPQYGVCLSFEQCQDLLMSIQAATAHEWMARRVVA